MFCINTLVLDLAGSNGLPVAIIFIDLCNAFRSIAHGIIQGPYQAQQKVTIRTKQLSSPKFTIKRDENSKGTLSCPQLHRLTN